MLMYPRLAELREDHDLSQAEMAKILRVSQATYSRYETGRLDIPSQTLIALARYYGEVWIICWGWITGGRGAVPASPRPDEKKTCGICRRSF